MKPTLRLFAFAILIFCRAVLQAQDIPPSFLTNGNAGTEFYISFPVASPVYGVWNSSNVVKLYVSSPVATTVTVEEGADGYFQKKKTVAGGVIEFAVPVAIAQPYMKSYNQIPSPDAKYPNKALHIMAENPVTVYGVTLFDYTSEGFLAVPVSALGTQYTVASYADYSDNSFYYSPSEAMVVAAFDNTNVKFTLGGSDNSHTNGDGKGANGLALGESKTVTLGKGDVFLFSGYGLGADLSGSTLTADKPFGVISGQYCVIIPPVDFFYDCDFIDEMELPRHTWDTSYVVTKIYGRQKNSFIKIFAKEENTKVYRNGQLLGSISKIGGKVGSGFMDRRVADGTLDNYVITSDKPISITQYNSSKNDDNISSSPFQMLLTPASQWAKEIFFSLPGSKGSPTFANDYVNLIFPLDEGLHMPDDLQVGVVADTQLVWSSVKLTYGSVFDVLPQKINGRSYGMKTIKLTEGAYRVKASAPLAAYVYGFSNNGAYGFPASTSLNDRSVPDALPPVISFTVKKDGSVTDGVTTDMPADNAKRSNMAASFMMSNLSYNYTYTPAAFIPGAARMINWKLAVIDTTKPAKAVLVFIDRAGNDSVVTIQYAGTQPSSVAAFGYEFGIVTLGMSGQGTARLVNTGDQDVSVTGIEPPLNSEFTVSAVNFPYTLKAGKELSVTIHFQPTAEKQYSDRIIFYSSSTSSNVTASFTGEGVTPTITTDDGDFGEVTVGTTTDKVLAISNTGKGDLVLTSVTNPASSAFTYDLPPLPYTISPGGNLQCTVHFHPMTAEEYHDKIIFHSNSTKMDSVANLTAKGIVAVGVNELQDIPFGMRSLPNPSYGETVVSYHLVTPCSVRLSIVNTLGQEVKIISHGYEGAGDRQATIRTTDMSAGIYFIRLSTGARTEVQTLTVTK